MCVRAVAVPPGITLYQSNSDNTPPLLYPLAMAHQVFVLALTRPYKDTWKTVAHAGLWGVSGIALTLNFISGSASDRAVTVLTNLMISIIGLTVVMVSAAMVAHVYRTTCRRSGRVGVSSYEIADAWDSEGVLETLSSSSATTSSSTDDGHDSSKGRVSGNDGGGIADSSLESGSGNAVRVGSEVRLRGRSGGRRSLSSGPLQRHSKRKLSASQPSGITDGIYGTVSGDIGGDVTGSCSASGVGSPGMPRCRRVSSVCRLQRRSKRERSASQRMLLSRGASEGIGLSTTAGKGSADDGADGATCPLLARQNCRTCQEVPTAGGSHPSVVFSGDRAGSCRQTSGCSFAVPVSPPASTPTQAASLSRQAST